MALLAENRILITGSNGFIGRYLVRELLERGMEVFCVDRSPTSGGTAEFQVDLMDQAATRHVIDKIRPGFIFHLAGLIHAKNLEELYRGNVVPTFNLLEAIKGAKSPSRMVIPGSAAEYGRVTFSDLPLDEERLPNPVSLYGVTKVWQTTLARYYATQGTDVLVGRLFNLIGRGVPETLSIGAFAGQLDKIKRGVIPPCIAVGNLRPKRDFVDVKDACRGLIAVAEKGKSGEIYNICSGNSLSMEDILHLMIQQSGMEIEVAVDPGRVKGEDIDDIYGSYRKLSFEANWRPIVSIGESVKMVMG